MDSVYSNWINCNVTETYGHCADVTERMVRAFPDKLKRVKGHYYCPIWNDREHWWCVDIETGLIVDPTAAQFPSKGFGSYEEWDDSCPEPTGICMNCGEYTYNGDYFCCKS